MELPSPNALRTFEVTGRHESFRDAAEELNVSVGSVSRYIQLLETHLGLKLFERHTRGVSLSPAGRTYHESVTRSFNQIRVVTERLQQRTKSGARHIVWSLPTLGAHWLAPRMNRIKSAVHDFELHLSLDVTSADIAYRDIDFAVVPDYFAPRGSDKFRVVRLYLESFTPVCCPRRAGIDAPLELPQQIFEHPLLVYRHVSVQWNDWIHRAGIGNIDQANCMTVDSGMTAYHAATEGYGIALGERMKVADALRRGTLIAPFETVVDSGHFVCLCWRQHPSLDRMAEKLITILKREVRDTLGPSVDPNSTNWPRWIEA